MQKKPEWNNPEEERDFFWRLPQFVAQIRLNLVFTTTPRSEYLGLNSCSLRPDEDIDMNPTIADRAQGGLGGP